MRNQVLLLMILSGASGCASRPQQTSLAPTRYLCGDLELVRDGAKLLSAEVAADGPMVATYSTFRDKSGDHFVTLPGSPTQLETVEFVVPSDPRSDAIEKTYDTSRGSSRVDWRLTGQRACRAQGGYLDAFQRFMDGATMEEVAAQLSLADADEAKSLVHHALRLANTRYYRQ